MRSQRNWLYSFDNNLPQPQSGQFFQVWYSSLFNLTDTKSANFKIKIKVEIFEDFFIDYRALNIKVSTISEELVCKTKLGRQKIK